MEQNVIAKLTALLQKNPALMTQLMSVKSIDQAIALVKSQGITIAQQEMQEYITKNLASGDLAKDLLGKLGGGKSTGNVAGDLLKGILG